MPPRKKPQPAHKTEAPVSKMDVLPHFKPLYSPVPGVLLVGGRGRGASTAMAQALILYCSSIKIRCAVLREYMNSIADSCKQQIEDEINRDPLVAKDWRITESYLMHKITRSTIIFKGLKRNAGSIKSLAGIQLVVLEESENLTDESWQILEPTIRHPEGTMFIVIGNPKERNTCFGRMITSPPDGWVKVHSTYLDNPYTSATTLRQAEECKRRSMDEYNWVWLGGFKDDRRDRLIKRVLTADDSLPLEPDDATTVIGVDIARKGGDKTVIAVRKGRSFLLLRSYDEMDLPTLTSELKSYIRKYQPQYVNVDSTGHGAWLPDGLAANGITVTGHNFAARADDPDKYSNRRTELWGLLNDYLQTGGTVPHDNELLDELDASYYDLDTKGRFALVGKDEIRAMLPDNRSTDKADAVALACFTPPGEMFRTRSRQEQAVGHQMLAHRLLNSVKWK